MFENEITLLPISFTSSYQ